MTSSYAFERILLNGRNIKLSEILSGATVATTEFEQNTLSFIRAWLMGVAHFEQLTSGSTGPAKRIMLDRLSMEKSAAATVSALGILPGQTALLCLDPAFIGGKMMLVRALTQQLKIVATEPSADPFDHSKAGTAFHFTAVVPMQIEAALKSGNIHKLPASVTIIIGGAALKETAQQELHHVSAACYATYGMTETVSHIALKRVNGRGAEAAFRTLPGVVIDEDERGCLVITTDYLPGKVITNDIVQILSPTSFEWVGRADNVINTGGVKVSPEVVEEKIEDIVSRAFPGVHFLISSIPDEQLGEKVVIVFGQQMLRNPSVEQQLLQQIAGMTSKFERPREVFFLSQFPLTKSGKINRTAVKNLVAAQRTL